MMKKYTIKELKTAFAALYTTDCDAIWRVINFELAQRLDRNEYTAFVETVQNGEKYICGQKGIYKSKASAKKIYNQVVAAY